MGNKYGLKREPYKPQTRGKYNIVKNTVGKVGKENIVQRNFWKEHSVVDLSTKSPEELDAIIDEFFKRYQERNLKRDRNWWYPNIGKATIADIRNKRTNIDKAPKIL